MKKQPLFPQQYNNKNPFNAPRRPDNKKKITFMKDLVTEGTENYINLQCLGNET